MVGAHPNKGAFAHNLIQMIEKTTANVLFESNNESHVQGAEDAKNMILLFLNNQ